MRGIQAYLQEWVYDLPDRAAYWEKLGPEVSRNGSRPGKRIAEPVNYGDY